MSSAEGVKPGVEQENSGKTASSTAVCGNWTREIDGLITAIDHINQLEEVRFRQLGLLAGRVVGANMQDNIIDSVRE